MDVVSFKQREFSFLLSCILFTLILFGVHQYLLSYFFAHYILFYPLWHIYIFHFIITAVFYTIINYRYSSGHKNIFVVFMAGTFIKMALGIVFLLPLILSDFPAKQPDIFNFFIAYFSFLILEVIMLNKLLQK